MIMSQPKKLSKKQRINNNNNNRTENIETSKSAPRIKKESENFRKIRVPGKEQRINSVKIKLE